MWDLGSRTANIRVLPTLSRSPARVTEIAVGWCAKSSHTETLGAPQLHSAANALEARQGANRCRRVYACSVGSRDGGQTVQSIVLAHEIPVQLTYRLLPVEHLQGSASEIAREPTVSDAKAIDAAPASELQNFAHSAIGAVRHDAAGSRHGPHQMVKLTLNRPKIRKYVCVVELDIVQDRRSRSVVHHLRPLVEKRRVVLVSLDDEVLSRPQPCRHSKVRGYAANEESGRKPGVFQDPCKHRRSGRLPVRARHRGDPSARQGMVREPLRARDVSVSTVQDGLNQWIASTHNVADYPEIRLQSKLIGAVSLDEFNTLTCQLRAHRWIDVGIASSHPVSRFPGDDGDTAHERPADSHYVNMHWMER